MKIIDTIHHIHVLVEHDSCKLFNKQDKQLLESFGIVNMNARTKYDSSITVYKTDAYHSASHDAGIS